MYPPMPLERILGVGERGLDGACGSLYMRIDIADSQEVFHFLAWGDEHLKLSETKVPCFSNPSQALPSYQTRFY